ncbi:MAG: hypothetical protein ABI690_26125 [Chloroflexota bacterium]
MNALIEYTAPSLTIRRRGLDLDVCYTFDQICSGAAWINLGICITLVKLKSTFRHIKQV